MKEEKESFTHKVCAVERKRKESCGWSEERESRTLIKFRKILKSVY
jgi:hypothetical protein